MKEREELELILNLIRKYNLPLSPILEYAIQEKMEEYPETSTADDEEVSFTENISIEAGIEPPLQSYHDEQKSTIEGYSLQNQGNHCYIINDIGEKVFSSSGRLTIIEGEFYKVSYTYSFISMNLVKKDERELYVLGKRILNAHHRSPLYTALDEHEYLNQIKSIRFDYNTEEYHVQVDGRWYGSSGYFADFDQKGTEDGSKNIAEESIIKNRLSDLEVYGEFKKTINKFKDTKKVDDSKVKEENEKPNDEEKSSGGLLSRFKRLFTK